MLLSGRLHAAGQVQKISGNYKLHDDKLVSRMASGGINVRIEEILAGTGGAPGNLQVRDNNEMCNESTYDIQYIEFKMHRSDRRESASKFMAHAHTSVNVASRHYLSTERRYNYTTPKSFLEQISLYIRLLKTKSAELRARVARLENGLDKLRSTAVEVDKLKEKLAVQEVELQQKNEAADALIAIVGVETEKVQKEKAIGTALFTLP